MKSFNPPEEFRVPLAMLAFGAGCLLAWVVSVPVLALILAVFKPTASAADNLFFAAGFLFEFPAVFSLGFGFLLLVFVVVKRLFGW